MDLDKTSRLLKLNEGEDSWVYADSKGILTIGVGRNVDRKAGGPGLRQSEVDFMLKNDLEDWHSALARAIPWFLALSDVRQAVLIDMAHNLKGNVFGVLKFKNFLAALATERWVEAGTHLMDSEYAKQVGNRALRNKLMILTDRWPKGI